MTAGESGSPNSEASTTSSGRNRLPPASSRWCAAASMNSLSDATAAPRAASTSSSFDLTRVSRSGSTNGSPSDTVAMVCVSINE